MKRVLKFSLIIIILGIFVWTFYFLWSKDNVDLIHNYDTAQVAYADVEKTTVATGKIEPRNEINIKPQISGVIVELYKEAGQLVKKDEVIAKVRVIPEIGNLSNAESSVRQAKINFEQAQTNFDRIERLYAERLVSTEEYENAKRELDRSKESLSSAEDNLEIVKTGISKNAENASNTLVRSTVSGLILDIPVKVGNSVILTNTFNEGTTIATITDMNDLLFKGNVDETEVGRLKKDMPVKITLGALQGMVFNAKLEYISPKGYDMNGANQFEIKAALDVPDSVTVRLGYSANAEIVLERAAHVLTVPESTLEFAGDSTFVYALTDSIPTKQFERRAVTTGLSDGMKIEIKSGVEEGVVIRGNEIF